MYIDICVYIYIYIDAYIFYTHDICIYIVIYIYRVYYIYIYISYSRTTYSLCPRDRHPTAGDVDLQPPCRSHGPHLVRLRDDFLVSGSWRVNHEAAMS